MTRNFEDLVSEVGEWSERNFGDQKGVGVFAPLAGMVEEMGELAEAHDQDDLHDAFADIAIYFADFCYRGKVSINPPFTIDNMAATVGATTSMDVTVGKLAHVTLKTHQGIRKYADKDFADSQMSWAARTFWNSLVAQFEEESPLCFHDHVFSVWDHVKKRDWVVNPTNANEVVQAAVTQIQNEDPIDV